MYFEAHLIALFIVLYGGSFYASTVEAFREEIRQPYPASLFSFQQPEKPEHNPGPVSFNPENNDKNTRCK